MDKRFHEDWRFTIEVIKVGKENETKKCRLGLARGSVFECMYETPAGFCPTSFIKIFPSLEIVRSGGDLRNMGGGDMTTTVFTCPDGVVTFQFKALPIAS